MNRHAGRPGAALRKQSGLTLSLGVVAAGVRDSAFLGRRGVCFPLFNPEALHFIGKRPGLCYFPVTVFVIYVVPKVLFAALVSVAVYKTPAAITYAPREL